MRIALRKAISAASIATAFSVVAAQPVLAQSSSQHEEGMGGHGMGDMMGMMQGCPMMKGGGMDVGRGGMPHLPPGNEKLELQMHADMMKAVGDILAKYAARLPDRK